MKKPKNSNDETYYEVFESVNGNWYIRNQFTIYPMPFDSEEEALKKMEKLNSIENERIGK